MLTKYSDLPKGAQEVIQVAKQRFADCFDSDNMGPYISDFKRYDDDRIATLLDISIGQLAMYIMVSGVNFTVENYPYKNNICRQALILSLTIEIINHLVRSYVEQPDTSALSAPDVRRRDYLSRWRDVLRDYQDMMKQMGKRLNAELYTMMAEGGAFMNVLMDFPSASCWGWPVGYAEKPYWGWF